MWGLIGTRVALIFCLRAHATLHTLIRIILCILRKLNLICKLQFTLDELSSLLVYLYLLLRLSSCTVHTYVLIWKIVHSSLFQVLVTL